MQHPNGEKPCPRRCLPCCFEIFTTCSVRLTPNGGAQRSTNNLDHDAVFYEPNGVYRGRDEIDRIAGVIKASHPDFQYQPLSPPEEVGDGGRVRWVEGGPGKPPEQAGTDFIIARNGKIAAIYLFFDKLPS